MYRYRSKLIARRDIGKAVEKSRRGEKKIVFTNGVFDIIHMGHIHYLSRARAAGDVLIVGLNTDASVKKFKGKDRPLNRQADRAGVLSALECVDIIVYFSEETPERLIKQVRPDILVKGADYKINEIVGAEFVKSYGGRVRRMRLLPGRSTTAIIRQKKK